MVHIFVCFHRAVERGGAGGGASPPSPSLAQFHGANTSLRNGKELDEESNKN